jgi:hypothetical protein
VKYCHTTGALYPPCASRSAPDRIQTRSLFQLAAAGSPTPAISGCADPPAWALCFRLSSGHARALQTPNRPSQAVVERRDSPPFGGMDRRTLRDWVHRFNASGPEGLFDTWTQGPKTSLVGGTAGPVCEDLQSRPRIVRLMGRPLAAHRPETGDDREVHRSAKQITSIGKRKWVHFGQLS